jgi:hypothetical protein
MLNTGTEFLKNKIWVIFSNKTPRSNPYTYIDGSVTQAPKTYGSADPAPVPEHCFFIPPFVLYLLAALIDKQMSRLASI